MQADLPDSAPTVTITGPDGPVTDPFDVTIAFLEGSHRLRSGRHHGREWRGIESSPFIGGRYGIPGDNNAPNEW